MSSLKDFINNSKVFNASQLAEMAGINKSLLRNYLSDRRKLSDKDTKALEDVLKPFGYQSTIKEKPTQTPENTTKSEHKGFDPNNLIRRTPEEARKAKEQESKGAPSWWYGGKSETLNGRIARAKARNEGKDITKKPDKEKIKQAQEIINKSK